mmetsp:Transcript_935/g.1661  ORF Transcript_935/g.1661 Transcript_935/m.1661 type:complete len:515 (-) Transcript_935:238-1782(-)|eukprot:CAMPEP_0196657772 /NCGR_PEP_ID=MMETSP1086-20130531/25467_1 /TAXON_ID=77921 /ORGANISM="Cyanoptyche  gloeocystis , Strain SAG4.97" /LENGTH=514 /DNA_ID=CAMNT_0041991041 /DNA_START=122 /DNA_END=1666 /DNA_ORIENTATION=-
MTDSIPFDLKGYAEVRLGCLTVKTLQELCRERRIPISGPKDDLVSRLIAWKEESEHVKKELPPPVEPLGKEKVDDSVPMDLNGYAQTKLLDLTLRKLQELCRERGIPVSGSKQDLVDRLIDWKKDYKTSMADSAPTENDHRPRSAAVVAKNEDKNGEADKLRHRDGEVEKISPPNFKNAGADAVGDIVIISHNIYQFTLSNDKVERRIENLKNSYKKNMPDILVIQEVKYNHEPTAKLASALSSRGANYRFLNTQDIGNHEVGAFLYVSERYDLVGFGVGVPIYAGNSLVTRNLAKPLSVEFAEMCGFESAELKKHTFQGHDDISPLFARHPVYAVFTHKATQRKIVVCSLHLHSDPTKELLYVGHLLPFNLEHLKQKGITFLLCGDLNLTAGRTKELQEKAIHLEHTEGKFKFGLDPPFDRFVTNLGRAFLSNTDSKNQCFDNFIVPVALKCHAGVLELPGGFVNDLIKLREEANDPKGGGSRSSDAKAHSDASLLYSDHKAVFLQLPQSSLL